MRENLYKLLYEKGGWQRYLARRFLFGFFQKIGFHVTGNHFYELVPDTRFVKSNYTDAPRASIGIEWQFSECEREAVRLIKAYGSEFNTTVGKFGFTQVNNYFRGGDALLLYCFLRDLKPAKMIEVGQGFSTRVALAALERNGEENGTRCAFISIDPYARLADNVKPQWVDIQLLDQEVQAVDFAPLLKACDFLFVDSSHVYKFGSDVEFEFSRIYPQLQSGTIMHLHDIYLPWHYPMDWMVNQKRFWNEQYILESFLMFNSEFQILLPMTYLMRQSDSVPAEMHSLSLDKDFLFESSSFYLRRR